MTLVELSTTHPEALPNSSRVVNMLTGFLVTHDSKDRLFRRSGDAFVFPAPSAGGSLRVLQRHHPG